ncbi:PHP domain-containing protein [Candidatus Electronema sp. JC]|uniref:PHP domain-containing protein n=1 Tax=Candidatus Electronema sp. JC TaxID=3401570 RepID=UPI003B42E930
MNWLKTMCVDLHTHSVYSDGTATPLQLIRMAAASGLTGFALTDHDTVEGVAEAMRLGTEHGVDVLSGLELSARHGEGCIHILGYGVDLANPQLCAALARLQQGRAERNVQILDKLVKLGIAITMEETERLSACGQTGRPHIARLLLAKGYVQSLNHAFTLYLGRNKAAWCGRFAYSAAETIAIIHEAGGVAVLAHPGIIDPELKAQPQLVRELAERHLDGMEIHYPGHNYNMIQLFSGLAKQHGLIATGGSDYHGDSRIKGLAGRATGFFPPDSIMEQLRDRLRAPRTSTLNASDHADHTCC